MALKPFQVGNISGPGHLVLTYEIAGNRFTSPQIRCTMKPKKQRSHPQLFQSRLDQIIDLKHSLCRLAKAIDWDRFDEELGGHYVDMVGAPGKPTRLMVGLHYLKYAFDESDEGVVERFVDNPYWQFFCWLEYFQHTFPIDPSSMTRWRKRVGPEGVETLLAELIDTTRRAGMLSESSLKRVVVDTTVQEKAIAFPTDARLYEKMRRTLVPFQLSLLAFSVS